jgi:hypothetical protein
MSRLVPICGVALALAACDDHVFTGHGGGGGGACEPTWTSVQTVLDESCATCHGGPSAPAGVGIVLPDAIVEDLDDPASPLFPAYGELVVPGDSAASVLWQAIGHTGEVTPMPIGATEPIANADCVQQWIDDGAPLD